jgi:hypothetical protein
MERRAVRLQVHLYHCGEEWNNLGRDGSTQTQTKCDLSDSILRQGTAPTWNSSNGHCSATFTIDSSITNESNFGSAKVDCPGAVPDDPFKPVMFWFYGSGGQTSTMFCYPTVKAYNVNANLTLFNNTLIKVTPVSDFEGYTNVTQGPPLQGLALNG